MTDKQIKLAVLELRQAQQVADKAQDKADAIREELKQELERRHTDALETEYGTVHYTAVSSSRFDSKSFRQAFSDLYERFLKPSTTMRFTLI